MAQIKKSTKKSTQITLTVVAVAGLAGCGRRAVDPCEAQYFNQQACLEAVDRGGYYWNGTWFPMSYRPYPYYYDSYHTYVSRGGHVYSAPSTAYVHSGGGGAPAGTPGTASSPSVTRGGFGSTAAGHGAGE